MTEQELAGATSVGDIENLLQNQTRGERAAEWLTSRIGSWPYIIGQNVFIFLWCVTNSYLILGPAALDPFPWILLNLVMSFTAAQTGPVILISSNRQEKLLWALLHNVLNLVTAVSRQVNVIVRNDERMAQMMDILVNHAQRGEERDKKTQQVLERIAEFHDDARQKDEAANKKLDQIIEYLQERGFDPQALK